MLRKYATGSIFVRSFSWQTVKGRQVLELSRSTSTSWCDTDDLNLSSRPYEIVIYTGFVIYTQREGTLRTIGRTSSGCAMSCTAFRSGLAEHPGKFSATSSLQGCERSERCHLSCAQQSVPSVSANAGCSYRWQLPPASMVMIRSKAGVSSRPCPSSRGLCSVMLRGSGSLSILKPPTQQCLAHVYAGRPRQQQQTSICCCRMHLPEGGMVTSDEAP